MSGYGFTSLYMYNGGPLSIPKNTIVYFNKGTITPNGNYATIGTAENAFILMGNCTFTVS